jgi:hypothetical protein
MEFQITCSCGAGHAVGEGSAGAKFTCSCGREIAVPPLHELRRLAGVPLDPEFLIRSGLSEDDLFPDKTCCHCGGETAAWLPVKVECEPGYHEGGFGWGTFFLTALTAIFLPFGFILFRSRPKIVHYGKGYRLPVLICPECQKSAPRSEQTVKEWLRQVPVYRQLLDKYPKARAYVVKH